MWLETLSRAIRDIRDIMVKIQVVEDVKELNKIELQLHNLFQEYYGVLGNVTRETKQAIQARRLEIKRLDRINREAEREKALENIIENTPEQELVDASKLDEPVVMDLNGNIVTEAPELTEEQKAELEEIKKEVKSKKTAKKKTTKKAKK